MTSCGKHHHIAIDAQAVLNLYCDLREGHAGSHRVMYSNTVTILFGRDKADESAKEGRTGAAEITSVSS